MTQPTDLGIVSHLDAIRATFDPVAGLRLLDIGCGDSSLPRDLAALGAECTGVDPFMPGSDWADEGPGRWRLLRASAEALPLDDGSVDGVLFIYSLHHVPAAAMAPALTEVRRVLKPGGRLFVAEPVPRGDFDALISIFHDETAVRALAQRALDDARPLFGARVTRVYTSRRHYANFDGFARRTVANTRFNPYTADDVLAPAVRERFAAIAARTGGVFDQPVKVDVLEQRVRRAPTSRLRAGFRADRSCRPIHPASRAC